MSKGRERKIKNISLRKILLDEEIKT